jgi:hypothetical protein
MAKKSGSEDKYFEALDFIINVLKKHEQILDNSIQELATLTEYLENITVLNSKVKNAEEKINIVQKEVTDIVVGDLGPKVWASPVVPSVAVQSGSSLVLHCKQWADFEVLAMHAQTLSFCYKEEEKILQVCAIRGNQIIRFTGALPGFSIIYKAWFSRELNITESNIVEGFWDNPEK